MRERNEDELKAIIPLKLIMPDQAEEQGIVTDKPVFVAMRNNAVVFREGASVNSTEIEFIHKYESPVIGEGSYFVAHTRVSLADIIASRDTVEQAGFGYAHFSYRRARLMSVDQIQINCAREHRFGIVSYQYEGEHNKNNNLDRGLIIQAGIRLIPLCEGKTPYLNPNYGLNTDDMDPNVQAAFAYRFNRDKARGLVIEPYVA